MLNTMLILMKKIQNFKLVIMQEFSNTTVFLLKDILQIGQKTFLLEKIKNTLPWIEVVGTFYKKEIQKATQEKFRIEKVIQKKENKLYVKWKGYDNSFNSYIDKKDIDKNESILS